MIMNLCAVSFYGVVCGRDELCMCAFHMSACHMRIEARRLATASEDHSFQ